MRRTHPFLSPVGFAIAILLFTGLGISIWRKGGQAFSPGDLSAQGLAGTMLDGYTSHAEFQRECRLCHQPMKSMQADLCMDCHKGVKEQISSMTGVHGKLSNPDQCMTCHPDHKGRNFDMTKAALTHFDHSTTSFSLDWHQVDFDMTVMSCSACHIQDQHGFPVSQEACLVCHSGYDMPFMQSHVQDFGASCLDCHDGADRMVGFDHSTTSFPLEGKHIQVSCARCHINGRFQGVTKDCSGCHTEPEVHQGLFNLDCAACHSAQGWKPAILDGTAFDHAANTSFSLARHIRDYQGKAMNCTACHSSSISNFDIQVCVACHAKQDQAFMLEHQDRFGPNCLDCHDGADRMSGFDHSKVFPLEDRHAEIECDACHINKVFKGTPNTCVGCHAEPEIHAGFFGLECQNCHTSRAWTPAFLRSHSFPLDHGKQGEVDCQVCHPTTYVEYTCYGCHEHQPDSTIRKHLEKGFSMAEIPVCAKCHPSGVKEGESNSDD